MKKIIAGLAIVCALTLSVSSISNEVGKEKVKEPVKMMLDPGTIG
ncbi:hypothetical protein R6231_10030 [Bacillus cytotoxicus]|uniref:Uncharacterized protein n=1 Tax=Bacillus cytotoxicus TaxID=580165 RepID=A0AAX2CJ93_9BACI|nr:MULTISPECIES: hypothetical protein [Bacillus cereus group]AWC29513.1 hypothetical protein CG483_015050 [Bacillus cytotoxicus]AWC33526.1 hypothetical protein CG482_014805 [Bacillus cytotoxicus]AWC37503.1 hypothetical protein CG481_014580 [Bacillus cytotoxicus]AWC41644.1 hypothetical protein CG480_015050 [Bacillus cytotoxicus]AWC45488.1 hypothetical protein CG479_014000 [Bacillus cytotoxicus]